MAEIGSIRGLAEAGMARTLAGAPRLSPDAPGVEKTSRRLEGTAVQGDEAPFKDQLASLLDGVNQLQLEAGAKAEALARGSITDLHQVMLAQEEASVAFKLVIEMRNRIVAAYQEIIRMPL
jgi:flagellar hook-basal body complex protein FliE